jgi:hypothetical protein
MTKARTALFIALLSSTLSCGDEARIVPIPVRADAGELAYFAVGGAVSLNCNLSTPPSGTCSWTLVSVPAGSHAAFQDATSHTPTFTADLEGLYQAELAYTAEGVTDKTQVGVLVVKRPAVSVSPDVAVAVGETATVEASATGTEGDVLTYHWKLTTKPAGSVATLGGADEASATLIPDVAGTYVTEVVAADHTVKAEPVQVSVTAAAR